MSNSSPIKAGELALERIIFASRWIQAPVYLGLILGAMLYTYKFAVELIHLTLETPHLTEEQLMLGILTLVDVSMVLNLLFMVVIGGYATFVSHMDIYEHEDRPDWLEKIDAGMLKVKLAAALVSISAIHLLKAFVNIENKSFEQLKWQVILHLVFLLSAVVLALMEWVIKKSHH
ncbi:MAG: TIGR00645 family protein [bacterium]|nr:TIGR00645 family protein [bacterium]